MEQNKAKLDALTRRSVLGTLGITALNTTLLEAESVPLRPLEENILLSGAESIGDVGTLYAEVERYAARSRYPLSFLNGNYRDIDAYRKEARARIFSLLHYDPGTFSPAPRVLKKWEYDDYVQEKVLFSTTPWFQTTAYVLIPKKRPGPRPAIVDLHSHGGMFVFGKEKVMPMPGGEHPSITQYRLENYEGRSTSLELCKRGYVVISIDCFYFGERRSMFPEDLAKLGPDRSKYTVDDVTQLNRKAGSGESILARSLFWAGTTWQGVAHWDDIRTIDYLTTRQEVDPNRIGCVGISMGGYRTDFLAGLDDRIRCAVSVGWMSPLRPLIQKYVTTHSFMHFLPGLTRFMDLPDVIGCMAPKPLMVQQCAKDALYSRDAMQQALDHIAAIYQKVNSPSQFQGRFYDAPHTFSIKMQDEAFDWLDQWLKP